MGKNKRIKNILSAWLAGVLFTGALGVLGMGVQPVYAANEDHSLTIKKQTVGNKVGTFDFDFKLVLAQGFTTDYPTTENTINGSSSDDNLSGDNRNDVIFGLGGNDKLYGNGGDDILYAGSGDDMLYGGDGNDTLHGGSGKDTYYGGAGNDILVFDGEDTAVTGINEGNDIYLNAAFYKSTISITDNININDVLFSKTTDNCHLVIKFNGGSGSIKIWNYFQRDSEAQIKLASTGRVFSIASLLPNEMFKPLSDSNVPAGATWNSDTKSYNFTLSNDDSVKFRNLPATTSYENGYYYCDYTVTEKSSDGWEVDSVTGIASDATITGDKNSGTATGKMVTAGQEITFTNRKNTVDYTVTYNSNGGSGTMTDPNSPYEVGSTVTVLENTFTKDGHIFSGWNTNADGSGTSYANGATFTISSNVELFAQWTPATPDVTVPLEKRFLQNTTTTIPDMTFSFKFTQQSEWEGVNFVSTATPIADKSVTITSDSQKLYQDDYIGDLTGKTLYQGKIENVLSDFNPSEAGTYCYLVEESIPTPKPADVTYTLSQFVLKVNVDSNKKVTGIDSITLYKDGSGKTSDQYTTAPAVFSEKQELIFYNTYGPSGGTTPTGIITNIAPFIIVGGGGVAGLVAYVVINAKRKAKQDAG